ncbi:hypothetical protein IFM89_032753 [Coptis chinensis]|uniref:Uncharacterized protein n=1 Tax=Coptis chinensis TaxID=261450 RepID=A0A835LPJ3_9MAGN|nr:hypothetical protein IFM89_032753 [Coptis chinensis]
MTHTLHPRQLDVKLKTSATMVFLKELHRELFHLLGLLCTKCAGKLLAWSMTSLLLLMTQLLMELIYYLSQLGGRIFTRLIILKLQLLSGHFMPCSMEFSHRSASAGDRGFLSVTVQSGAPWILTVAASTMDRKFITNITLGNNKTLTGPAINVFPTSEKFYPVVQDGFCLPGEMNPNLTKRNIVFCNPTDLGIDGSGPLVYGTYGTIMIARNEEQDVPYSYPLPATAVNYTDSEYIASYISSTR